MRKAIPVSLIGGILCVLILAACGQATPPPGEPEVIPTPRADYFGGGWLYDNWMGALQVDAPAGDHPLWKTQTTNTRSGADTWRCKECHGWDYKGAEGAYGSGSHMTGFKGLLGAATMSDADLLAWLNGGKNPDHNFSPYMPETNLMSLVDFIQEGMRDTAQYINSDKTLNGGDPAHGKELFDRVCAECHGEDGKELNFGDESEPEYVGTIALDNPWEFWHKVSFGQPATLMPSALRTNWPLEDILDVLAYAQTLPGE